MFLHMFIHICSYLCICIPRLKLFAKNGELQKRNETTWTPLHFCRGRTNYWIASLFSESQILYPKTMDLHRWKILAQQTCGFQTLANCLSALIEKRVLGLFSKIFPLRFTYHAWGNKTYLQPPTSWGYVDTISQMLHVWHIYLLWPQKWPKCR